MAKVLIVAEGQTEETFIRELIAPYLASRQVFPIPILLTTSRTRAGNKFGGGVTSYDRLRNDVVNLLNDSSAVCVTTMLDFYGLPNDFPGIPPSPRATARERAEHLQRAFAHDINDHRFRAFLTLHEFEALLFTSPSEIAGAFPEENVARQLHAIRDGFASPEDINNGRDSHPSQRILNLLPTYRKRTSGINIARRIGLPTIRAHCPHFNNWLTHLEYLTDS